MKERPILFSAPMVRAILAGTKTQTRRVLRVEMLNNDIPGVRVPGGFVYLDFDGVPGLSWRPRGGGGTEPYPADRIAQACPFGVPGDRLWVRESGWYHVEHYEQDEDSECCSDEFYRWKATPREGCRRWLPPLDQTRVDRITFLHDSTPLEHAPKGDPRPSIFMPRWASRITLEVTSVRVERLQEITEEDARAEGFPISWDGVPYTPPAQDPWQGYASASFSLAWDTINGKAGRSWADNPWCWVVSFRRVQP